MANVRRWFWACGAPLVVLGILLVVAGLVLPGMRGHLSRLREEALSPPPFETRFREAKNRCAAKEAAAADLIAGRATLPETGPASG